MDFREYKNMPLLYIYLLKFKVKMLCKGLQGVIIFSAVATMLSAMYVQKHGNQNILITLDVINILSFLGPNEGSIKNKT